MRQVFWIVFQLSVSVLVFKLYADDPLIDMKKWGGQAAIASFFMAGAATLILVGLIDLFRWLRVRAHRRLQDKRPRDVVGTERLGVSPRHLPPQGRVGRIGHDVKDLI